MYLIFYINVYFIYILTTKSGQYFDSFELKKGTLIRNKNHKTAYPPLIFS